MLHQRARSSRSVPCNFQSSVADMGRRHEQMICPMSGLMSFVAQYVFCYSSCGSSSGLAQASWTSSRVERISSRHINLTPFGCTTMYLTSLLVLHAGDAGEDFGPGILEIKCPFNRGRPQDARPPDQPQWYYMPQVQPIPAHSQIPASYQLEFCATKHGNILSICAIDFIWT